MKRSNEESKNAGIPLPHVLVSLFLIQNLYEKNSLMISASSAVRNIFAA